MIFQTQSSPPVVSLEEFLGVHRPVNGLRIEQKQSLYLLLYEGYTAVLSPQRRVHGQTKEKTFKNRKSILSFFSPFFHARPLK